ncbi:efflux RND transporter periplasmic adaptor subunit [Sorangium sp. So ce513]|uniref:efflux RND transporter periplasmic adaptor subunit n=1 Tax=Sorangium sp. So ce513 TaxID=3133315 RepID=UPI003F62EA41
MSTTTTSSRAGNLLLSFALLALAAPAAGCATKASASDATATEAAAAPVRVETAAVREAPMPRSLALTGTLRGDRETDLAANATGRVLETFVERGSEVKKGDLLARLDVRAAALTAAEAQANAALTRAQEETARRECERHRALFESGAISRAEHDRIADQCRSAPLSVAAAAARARAAAQSVGDGQIRAPFDGTITERFVDVGEYVRHDSRVVALVSRGAPRLQFTVPEASLAAVRPGGALTFTVPAYPGRSFTGAVRWIGGAVREATRDLVAEAEVQDPDGALRPGMFASIALATGEAPSLVVPRSAIVPRDGRAHLFVVVDRRLEERVVQTGAEKGDDIAVLRGVRAGEAVVINPSEALQNGLAVE